MGACMFNYVFYMPSSLPFLHTAMPTPCLNAFWHSDPYILLHFFRKCFLIFTYYTVQQNGRQGVRELTIHIQVLSYKNQSLHKHLLLTRMDVHNCKLMVQDYAYYAYSFFIDAAVDYTVSVSKPHEGRTSMGSTITLHCDVQPEPSQGTTYVWFSSVKGFTYYSHNSTTSAFIVPVHHPSIGHYYCHVYYYGTQIGVGSTTVEVTGGF